MKSSITHLASLPKNCSFSIPKTQPTRNSSSANNASTKNVFETFYQIHTCPEVSQFTLSDNFLYTHKMNIDYGHLEQPEYFHKYLPLKKTYKNMGNQKVAQQSPEPTQRNEMYTIEQKYNEKQTAIKSKSMIKLSKESEDMEIQPKLIILQSGNKKDTPMNQLAQFSPKLSKFNPQATLSNTKNYNQTQSKTKLKQILASKNSVQSIDDLKIHSQQSTFRNEFGKQNSSNDKERTVRAPQHCRIVRSYVGGSKMQIKIINYPDCSQYRKVCGYIK